MRTSTGTLVVSILMLASCSSSGSSTTTPPPSSPTVETGTDTPVEDATVAPTIADDTTSSVAEPDVDATTGFEQLENLKDTASEVDAALAELAAIVGPIDGAATIVDDDTIFPSLTHVLAVLDDDAAALTPEQAAAVDAAVADLFDPDGLVIEFSLFDEVDPAPSTERGEGFAPAGFASTLASPDDDPTFDEAPEELQRTVRDASEVVRSILGGAPLDVWVQLFEPGAFGRVAGRNIGLAVGDPRRDDFPTGPDCLMQITSGPLPADIVGIVAHELTHCWQFTRLGFDAARLNATGDWAKEGMAGHIGEIVQPTRFNAEWWAGYLTTRIDGNGQWDMFSRSYDAIGFWSRIAAGGDVVAAMRRTIDAAPSDSAMFDAATSDLGTGRAWLGAGTFERSDWGAGWTGSGPGSPGTPRSVTAHTVIERNDVALSSDAGAQSNHVIAVSPVAGADGSVVTARGVGFGVLRVDPDDVVLSGATFVEEWCIGVCECPDGSAAFSDARVRSDAFDISASLVGAGSGATTLRVRTATFDPDEAGRCDPEEEPAPAPSGDTAGLIGTWKANPESVAAVFEQASGFGAGGAGFDVAGAAGDVLMTFAPGGTGTLDYDGVTLFLADEIIGDLTIDGSGAFVWSTGGDGVRISGTTFAYGVTSTALGGELLTIADTDVPASGTTTLSADVDGDVLVISSADGSAGRVFFPTVWTRQER